jgi:hypothetical protein
MVVMSGLQPCSTTSFESCFTSASLLENLGHEDYRNTAPLLYLLKFMRIPAV